MKKVIVFFVKSELSEGTKLESEHKDLVDKIRKQVKKYGTIKLTDKQIFEIIAKMHIKENPDYYKLLKKYVESDEVKKSFNLVFVKSIGHKYVKRTGSPGNYKYWYKDGRGKLVEGRKSEKIELKKRLLHGDNDYLINAIMEGSSLERLLSLYRMFTGKKADKYTKDFIQELSRKYRKNSLLETEEERKGGKI